jgi:hypothetical protein
MCASSSVVADGGPGFTGSVEAQRDWAVFPENSDPVDGKVGDPNVQGEKPIIPGVCDRNEKSRSDCSINPCDSEYSWSQAKLSIATSNLHCSTL